MTVVVIEPPTEVVTVAEAKRHIPGIDHNDDDDYIAQLIAAATKKIDAPSWVGLSLGRQMLEFSTDRFDCDEIKLPFPPILEVISVAYSDGSGVAQTLDPSLYERVGSYVRPVFGGSWPSASCRRGSVRIRYYAGHGAFDNSPTPVWKNAIPMDLKVAILMTVAQWYANREPVVIGATVAELPNAVREILNNNRVYG